MTIKHKKAQVMLEFLFCMMILFFMIYGIIEVFRWTGTDLANARRTHENLLRQGGVSSADQLNPEYYTPTPFRAIVGE